MAERKQLNWDLSQDLTHLWASAFIPLSCWHSQGSEGCGSATSCFGESQHVWEQANLCPHCFSSDLFCGACFTLASATQPCTGGDPLLVPCWVLGVPWNFQSGGIRSVWGVPCHMDRSYLEGISCFQSSWERIANSSPYATEYSPA